MDELSVAIREYHNNLVPLMRKSLALAQPNYAKVMTGTNDANPSLRFYDYDSEHDISAGEDIHLLHEIRIEGAQATATPSYNDKEFFRIETDFDHGCWRFEDFDRATLHPNLESLLQESHLPFELFHVNFAWIINEIARACGEKVSELLAERILMEEDEDEPFTYGSRLFGLSHLDFLGLAILRWNTWLRILWCIANGDLSEELQESEGKSPNRNYAAWALKFRAHDFWEWIEDQSLDSVNWENFNEEINCFHHAEPTGMAPLDKQFLDFEYHKKTFRSLGFREGFRIDLSVFANFPDFDFSDAPDFDTSFAKVEHQQAAAQSAQSRHDSPGPTPRQKKANMWLSWGIPLLIGTAVAVGASMGY